MSSKPFPILAMTSDWHLAKGAWLRYPTLTGDSYYSLKQIVDFALRHDIDVVAAGDLFDRPNPDSKSVAVAVDELGRLKANDVNVYFTQGQHEKVKDRPWLSLAGNAVHIHRRAVELPYFPLKLYGIDYTRADELAAELERVPSDTDILVMHQVWRNFMGNHCVCDGEFSMVPPVPFLLTGDYHRSLIQREIIGKHRLTVISPGSMCMQSIDEEADKSFFVLYSDLSIGAVPLETRKTTRVMITTERQLQEFVDSGVHSCTATIDYHHPDIAKPIIDIRYDPDIDNIYNRLVTAVDGKAHLFVRRINKYQATDNRDNPTHKLMLKKTLVDCLDQFCDKDSVEYDWLKRLINTSDAQSELEALLAEYEA